MRDLQATATRLGAALGLMAVVTADSDLGWQGCPAAPLQAEFAQEEVAADYRFQLLQRDVKRSEAIKPVGKPENGADSITGARPELQPLESLEHLKSLQRLQSLKRAPLSLAAGTASAPGMQVPKADCDKFPFYCHPEVDCPSVSEDDVYKQMVQVATDDGHANYQSWCITYPHYGVSMPMCLFGGDKQEFATYMFQEQLALGATEIDAFYCFGAGHCNNTKVTLNTTVPEAEELCTETYGDEWKKVGFDAFNGAVERTQGAVAEAYRTGVITFDELLATTKRETGILAMTACAQGNFACDVFYCKANYCENEGYKKQFGWAAWAN